jgi:hypothetical protein
VDDFELATGKSLIAQMVFDEVDDYLTFPLKQMGLATLFNGTDVKQTRDYIKISVKTYLEWVCETHTNGWMQLPRTQDKHTTPLPHRRAFI